MEMPNRFRLPTWIIVAASSFVAAAVLTLLAYRVFLQGPPLPGGLLGFAVLPPRDFPEYPLVTLLLCVEEPQRRAKPIATRFDEEYRGRHPSSSRSPREPESSHWQGSPWAPDLSVGRVISAVVKLGWTACLEAPELPWQLGE
ncbi:MAG: hypothetical protein JW751_31265 [Polyangiaceae bacterium]|nr:hypothetical protein [Polyangiaceae bacterium]